MMAEYQNPKHSFLYPRIEKLGVPWRQSPSTVQRVAVLLQKHTLPLLRLLHFDPFLIRLRLVTLIFNLNRSVDG